MGEPTLGNTQVPLVEYIGQTGGTEGTETSKYLQEKRSFPE